MTSVPSRPESSAFMLGSCFLRAESKRAVLEQKYSRPGTTRDVTDLGTPAWRTTQSAIERRYAELTNERTP